MSPETIRQIAELRTRWTQAKQQEIAECEASEKELWERLRKALLSGRKFLSPCECDVFLEAVLEGRKPQCSHYSGQGLFWWLQKQGF